MGKVAYVCVHLNKIGLFALALGSHHDSDCINNIHTDGNFDLRGPQKNGYFHKILKIDRLRSLLTLIIHCKLIC